MERRKTAHGQAQDVRLLLSNMIENREDIASRMGLRIGRRRFGHVRGRNVSGGNTGERPFLYLVKEDDAYVVDGKPDSPAAIAYRNICN